MPLHRLNLRPLVADSDYTSRCADKHVKEGRLQPPSDSFRELLKIQHANPTSLLSLHWFCAAHCVRAHTSTAGFPVEHK